MTIHLIVPVAGLRSPLAGPKIAPGDRLDPVEKRCSSKRPSDGLSLTQAFEGIAIGTQGEKIGKIRKPLPYRFKYRNAIRLA